MPRIPLSKQFPWLAPAIMGVKTIVKTYETSQPQYWLEKNTNLKKVTRLHKHNSLLRRKLGDANPMLQEQKIVNLRLAAKAFDGVVIAPGQVFSFWKLLGQPNRARGFVDGMLLSDGKVVVGVGGGLCQMANLLYWLALHSPLEIAEHHHHSVDVFPDSGRVLPFGSGASVFFNYLDLQFKNPTPHNLLLRVWLTETHLCGEFWFDAVWPHSYKVIEENHRFYEHDGIVYRANVLLRLTHNKSNGRELRRVVLRQNNARVLYPLAV